MSAISLAANGYSRIFKTANTLGYGRILGSRLVEYLTREAVPAIDQLLRLPDFRNFALATLDRFRPESGAPLRPMIDELKDDIRKTGDIILNFAEDHEELLEQYMHESVNRWRRAQHSEPAYYGNGNQTTADTVVIEDDAAENPTSESRAIDDVRSSLESLRRQCNEEWVSGDDFFGPVFGIYDESGDQPLRRGEFIIANNPNLSYVGNFVARCLLVRCDSAIKVLREVTDELRVTFNAARNGTEFPWIALQERVDAWAERLRESLLHVEEAKLAEAAMTLVQIHAEFLGKAPSYDWLPIAPSVVQGFRVGLRYALESVRGADAAERINDALQRFRDWFERQPTHAAALAEAIANGGLVIDEDRRRVYWDKHLIPVDWFRYQERWRLLLNLAIARGAPVVSPQEFYDRDKKNDFGRFAVLKSALNSMLPRSLRQRIIAVPNEGYRLDLYRGSIHVFSDS